MFRIVRLIVATTLISIADNVTAVPTRLNGPFARVSDLQTATSCHAASLHFRFVDATAPGTTAMTLIDQQLKLGVSSLLGLSPDTLGVRSVREAGGNILVEVLINRVDALALGNTLHAKIISGQFDPAPSLYLKKMWMVEVFDCKYIEQVGTHVPSESPLEMFTPPPRQMTTTQTTTTWSPVDTTFAPLDLVVPSLPDHPCKPAGKLHIEFGGDLSAFGQPQTNTLRSALEAALKLSATQLDVEVVQAFGTVQVIVKFKGTQSIDLGYDLEKQVESGHFNPLPLFPLTRLFMEEVYCTEAPSAAPSVAPTADPSFTPTERPTSAPSTSPSEVPTTLAPISDEPSFAPTHTPTEAPSRTPTETPTEIPSIAPSPLPTNDPTRAPSNLPTTRAPTGCVSRQAQLHVVFRKGQRPLSGATDDLSSHDSVLHQKLADELRLSRDALKIGAVTQAGDKLYTSFGFNGLDSIKLGYGLEQKVLSSQFNPLPDYPIARIWMEEIFDCNTQAPLASPEPHEPGLDLRSCGNAPGQRPCSKPPTEPDLDLSIKPPKEAILDLRSDLPTFAPSETPTPAPSNASTTTAEPSSATPTSGPTASASPTVTPSRALPEDLVCLSQGDPHIFDFYGTRFDLHSPGTYHVLALDGLTVQLSVKHCGHIANVKAMGEVACNYEMGVKIGTHVFTMGRWEAPNPRLDGHQLGRAGSEWQEVRQLSGTTLRVWQRPDSLDISSVAEVENDELKIRFESYDPKDLSYQKFETWYRRGFTISIKNRARMASMPGLCGGGNHTQYRPIGESTNITAPADVHRTKNVGGYKGTSIEARCPIGSHISTWKIRSAALVDSIQGQCSDGSWLHKCGGNGGSEWFGSLSSQKVDVRFGSMIDSFGGHGGTGGQLTSLDCGEGFKIDGYSARCGEVLYRVELLCVADHGTPATRMTVPYPCHTCAGTFPFVACTCAEWHVPSMDSFLSHYVEYQAENVAHTSMIQATVEAKRDGRARFNVARAHCLDAFEALALGRKSDRVTQLKSVMQQMADNCALDSMAVPDVSTMHATWEGSFCEAVDALVDDSHPAQELCAVVTACKQARRLTHSSSSC